MAGKIYGIFDANGVMVNRVVLEEPLPRMYWPGYGRYYYDLSGTEAAPIRFQLTKLPHRPTAYPQIGDKVDLVTGVVTKFVPRIYDQGDGTMVASAPVVVLKDERL